MTRLLVFDIKKPDYLMIRQQLESTYATSPQVGPNDENQANSSNNNNLLADQQLTNSRVFGK